MIGRWGVPDLLAELAFNITPYRYCLNNPINYVDPYGLWETVDGGYQTNEKEDIERFMSYLSFETGSLRNTPSFDQMSNFIDGEMSESGLGALSNGSILLSPLTASVYRQIGGGIKMYADKGSFDNFWHQVQGNLTPNALDTRTLNKNYVGSYPGPHNPRKYNGDDDYSYMPSNVVEYPAIIHDLAYDKLKIKGAAGLFKDPRAIEADWNFVKQEMAIGHLSPDIKIKLQAYGLAIGLGAAATPKTVHQSINKITEDVKISEFPGF